MAPGIYSLAHNYMKSQKTPPPLPPPIPEKTGLPDSLIPRGMRDLFPSKGKLTKTGVVVVIITVTSTLIFTLALPTLILPRVLPPGTPVPSIAIIVFTMAFGAGVFRGLSWITGMLGLPTYKAEKRGP